MFKYTWSKCWFDFFCFWSRCVYMIRLTWGKKEMWPEALKHLQDTPSHLMYLVVYFAFEADPKASNEIVKCPQCLLDQEQKWAQSLLQFPSCFVLAVLAEAVGIGDNRDEKPTLLCSINAWVAPETDRKIIINRICFLLE